MTKTFTSKPKQEWLQDRYYLVRYENLVAHTNSTVYELYSFIGIPVLEAVTEFIALDLRRMASQLMMEIMRSLKTLKKYRKSGRLGI